MRDFEIGNGNVAIGAGAWRIHLEVIDNTAIGTRALEISIPNGTVTITVNDGGLNIPLDKEILQ